MLPVVCGGCGEPLDRGSTLCRACGEDNSAEALELPEFEFDLSLELDTLQPWSKVKHHIIEKYLSAYTTILRTQPWARAWKYYDAFSGAGVAVDVDSDELVAAGALRALEVEPRFSEYHFIDSNPRKLEILERLARGRSDVHIHRGDYRDILPRLLTQCRYEDFTRGLCLLDPYGLSVDYALLEEIAAMKSVEIFFNFMLVSANRNVLWNVDPATLSPRRKALMTRVWGHDRWPEELYEKQPGLFGATAKTLSNERVIAAYRRRLHEAGFKYVPEPIAMKNSASASRVNKGSPLPAPWVFCCKPPGAAWLKLNAR
jgi:three-Cys-motif partner protein